MIISIKNDWLLMLCYYKELIYYIQRMVGDKDKAQDIVQETYCRAIEIDSRIVIENKRAYLYKMARNIVFDESNKKKKDAKILFEENSHIIPKSQQPEEIAISINQEETLMQIIQTLPARSQQAFILYTVDGYSRQEISKKMGITSNAVEKHITRATIKIQKKLEEV